MSGTTKDYTLVADLEASANYEVNVSVSCEGLTDAQCTAIALSAGDYASQQIEDVLGEVPE